MEEVLSRKKQQRDQAKEDSHKKKETDKMQREKDKLARQDRKDKEKKRTQKGERKRWEKQMTLWDIVTWNVLLLDKKLKWTLFLPIPYYHPYDCNMTL